MKATLRCDYIEPAPTECCSTVLGYIISLCLGERNHAMHAHGHHTYARSKRTFIGVIIDFMNKIYFNLIRY